jgi:hypothetical protein
MPERLIGAVLKTAVVSEPPGVRIPLPPPKPLARKGLCAARPWEGSPRICAGTVTVFEGVVTWRSIGPGSFAAVFPNTEEAQKTVTRNASYQFALAPGDYVFQAHFPSPANPSPFVSVTVRSGITMQVDIPNMCK